MEHHLQLPPSDCQKRKNSADDLVGHTKSHGLELVTITLQALLLVEKVEAVQVCSTLHLRDQRSLYVNARWM